MIVEAPIELEGKRIGWKTLYTKENIHETIIEQNMAHLEQAQLTPFGSGYRYKHLHGKKRWKI